MPGESSPEVLLFSMTISFYSPCCLLFLWLAFLCSWHFEAIRQWWHFSPMFYWSLRTLIKRPSGSAIFPLRSFLPPLIFLEMIYFPHFTIGSRNFLFHVSFLSVHYPFLHWSLTHPTLISMQLPVFASPPLLGQSLFLQIHHCQTNN